MMTLSMMIRRYCSSCVICLHLLAPMRMVWLMTAASMSTKLGGEEVRLPIMNRHDRCDQLLVWDDRVRAHSEE